MVTAINSEIKEVEGETAIEVRQLHKWFRGNHVLRGLDLKIYDGTSTVIVGGSGAGKSVLLKHIIGLARPASGNIYIYGEELTGKTGKHLEAIQRKFAMVFQGSALLNSLTVAENVGLGLTEQRRFSKKHIAGIVREKLALVGLEGKDSQLPGELSGGMKKRVGVARALAMDPEILLFDEPTTGLDPVMAERIDTLIDDLKSKLKKTTVIVTHDMDSAFKLSDRIVMIYDGKIVEEGSPEEFLHSTNPVVEQFTSRFKRQGAKENP
ncbi:MAG: ABC transporter ATP-binding protein [Candidatus Brocadiales bacterium]|nr:ABC transporter ATP-binding protein [Candidatus Bathyanammoxibius sp.]MCQ4573984.1 ABC transporter ATP-binding protein [Candidatus Bathyanammoxibius amoris]